MITLPDLGKTFDYENNFYLSCDSSRMAKAIAHYKIFEKTARVEGEIVECGIFKGASFSRFAMYRKILSLEGKKNLIGFDSFGEFPETNYDQDKELREKFITGAGSESVSKGQLLELLTSKNCDKNVSLIEGDITKTVPDFALENKSVKISLLNLDVDIYEPTVVILNCLYPMLSVGGIMILDDYGTFPGETTAVDEFIKRKDIKIQQPLLADTPCFIVKT